jgi:tetratricopeptide (TPR) repeat protein
MWLAKEHKYARFSLKVRNRQTAIDKAEKYYYELKVLEANNKPYFSITTKEGVERYLKQRQIDVEDGIIVKGRYSTIKTHLEHWLNFIKKDVKLKELDRMDCYNYSSNRTKTKRGVTVSQSTVLNEQSTINAMMSWLYKNKLTDFDAFEFRKLKRIDKGNDELRRSIFTQEEISAYWTQLNKYLDAAIADYKKALLISPNMPFTLNNMASVYRKKGKSKEAIENYTAAIKLKGDYYIAYTNRGRAKLDAGDFKGALEDFSKTRF